jgi:hypothetical protein
MAAFWLVHRIGLEHPYALLSGIVNGAREQLVLVSLAAMDLGDVGAHNRPDRGVVDRLHDPGALQLAVVLARPEADPPDRGAVGVADEARYAPGADQRPQFLLMAGAVFLAHANPADLPVVHAPAAAHDRTTGQAEQLFEVRPSLVCQRSYLKHG